MDSYDRGYIVFYIKRLFILVGSLSGAYSFLLLFSERFRELLGYYTSTSGVVVVWLLVSATSFSMVYLQSGAKRSATRININPDISSGVYISRANKVIEEVERKGAELNDKLDTLDKKLGETEGKKILSAEERQQVIDGAIKSSRSDAIKEIFSIEAARLETHLSDALGLDRLASASKNSISRLMREISDLRLRSNINLIIGMAITAGGLWLLWTTVSMIDASELLRALAAQGTESDSQFMKSLILPLIPRVLLVVFVEVFAYFFLRLYRNGLSEIKYFQNELTNIESRLTAVEFAYITKNNDALKAAIEALSVTERNFVLGKGQTTVELERARSEKEFSRLLVKAIPRLLQDRKK